jgi:PAS domain S-box-containing protein
MSKLLIVDDDEQNLYMLRILLQGNGYDVESATNGAEALENARQDPPDMIISDILMPVMDGFTLCRKVKQDTQLQHIPFVFCTATYTESGDEELALKLGAERYLTKPIEPAAFIKVLQEIGQNPEKIPVMPQGSVVEGSVAEGENETYRLYNERLVKKLEKKMLDLEQETADRKRTEKALRKSEKQFRLLAENARDLIYRYRLTPTRGFEYVSPAATTLTGYTPEEHYADPELGFKLIYPEDRPLFEAVSSSPSSFENPLVLRWIRKDGTVLWTEQSNVPIYDQHGNLVAIEGVARDITERKKTEQALLESQTQLEIALDCGNADSWDMDLRASSLRYTPKWAIYLGYEPGEIPPTMEGITSIVHPDDVPRTVQDLTAYVEGKTERYETECRLKKKDGSWLWVLSRGKAVEWDEDGKPVRLLGTNVEITERKHAEEQLSQYADKLRAANAELAQYAYAASHDLQAPLRAIRNYADFLREDLEHLLDDEQKGFFEKLECAVQEAYTLIKDLLALSRIDRRSGDVETIDAGEFLRTIMASLDLGIRFK